MLNNFKYYILLVIGFAVIQGCTDIPTGNNTNQSPDTHLSLFPDSTISPGKTRLTITWWGDDPDGLVAGYNISFDSLNWTFTTRNDSTFQLAINGNDSTFRFWVAAVDDKGLVDPTPASNLYPVVNSPPSVKFNTGTEITDTSFPVAAFSWTGTDPDGDNTIRNYYWSLNDTVNWHEISSTTTSFLLRQSDGIVPGSNNKLYLKAKDVAGIYSPIVKMPDSNKTWFVRPVTGHILIIDDYPASILDNSAAAAFYQNALDSGSFSQHSSLDIKTSSNANLPRIKSMFTETMKLFQCVIWYAGRGNNTLIDNADFDLAQQTVPFYLAAGGKIFFTTGFPNDITSQGNIVDFAPIDSMTSYQVTTITSQEPVIVLDNSYPQLETGSVSPDRVRGIRYRAGSYPIYQMNFHPPYDTTKIYICIKNSQLNPNIVFMSVPIHRMDGLGNAKYFLRRVLGTDFGIN